MSAIRQTKSPVSTYVGIGLRAEHYHDIIRSKPSLGWLEIHSENYFGAGGKPLDYLRQIAQHYLLSFHGVGLSLGSSDPLDKQHLIKLKHLIEEFQPTLVSEHVCWSSVAGRHLHDLLPLPYTHQTLQHFIERVSTVQDYLGRTILIENISSYLQYKISEISEPEFLTLIAKNTGCGLLLDVNNVYVNARNHSFDARSYLDKIPENSVREIHLAGFTEKKFEDGEICIDTHNQHIVPEVWELYQYAVAKFGKVRTLIEWDTDLPSLDVLLSEAEKACKVLESKYEFIPTTLQDTRLEIRISQFNAEDPLTISTLQQQFVDAIFREPSSSLLACIQEDSISATRRLQVYRNNVYSTLTEVLKAHYPTIQRLVGEEFFTHLAKIYTSNYPSHQGNMHLFGEHFSGFVRDFSATRDLVYLSEVAQLDWAYHKAFHAADDPLFDRNRLKIISPDEYVNLQFRLHPSCQLFDFQYPILRIWELCQATSDDDQTVQLTEGGIQLMVIRRDRGVRFEPLEKAEYILLNEISHGKTFGVACEQALAADELLDITTIFTKHITTGTII